MLNETAGKAPNGEPRKKTLADYFSIAFATFGVGYFPLAPGTWGSAVAVGIYLLIRWEVANCTARFMAAGWHKEAIEAWLSFVLLLALLLFTMLGIWAAGRTAKLFGKKDPGKVVVDELMGQFIAFCFVPFAISWWMILAGFLLFRAFDIWKPYPIDALQDLPGGLGVCADDIVAGIYAGIGLLLIYAVSLSF